MRETYDMVSAGHSPADFPFHVFIIQDWDPTFDVSSLCDHLQDLPAVRKLEVNQQSGHIMILGRVDTDEIVSIAISHGFNLLAEHEQEPAKATKENIRITKKKPAFSFNKVHFFGLAVLVSFIVGVLFSIVGLPLH